MKRDLVSTRESRADPIETFTDSGRKAMAEGILSCNYQHLL